MKKISKTKSPNEFNAMLEFSFGKYGSEMRNLFEKYAQTYVRRERLKKAKHEYIEELQKSPEVYFFPKLFTDHPVQIKYALKFDAINNDRINTCARENQKLVLEAMQELHQLFNK